MPNTTTIDAWDQAANDLGICLVALTAGASIDAARSAFTARQDDVPSFDDD